MSNHNDQGGVPRTSAQIRSDALRVPKPEVTEGVLRITVHVPSDCSETIGTPWQPTKKPGVCRLDTLFICKTCGRAYTDFTAAMECRLFTCIGGVQ